MKKKKMLSLCLILALMIISNFAIATYEKKPTGEKINVEFSVESKVRLILKCITQKKDRHRKKTSASQKVLL